MAKEKAVEFAQTATAQVIEKLCGKIGPVMTQIAEGLGTSSEKIMTVFTKQAVADGIDCFVQFVVCFGVAFVWLKFSKIWADKIEKGEWDRDSAVGNYILSIFVYFILILIATSNLIGGIKRFINPEYYAFTEVLAKLSTLIGK
jgi:hypothetical protein